jgi:hypothetical protein
MACVRGRIEACGAGRNGRRAMTNRNMRMVAKLAQRERAAARAAARKPEPWTFDYHLYERLRDDAGAMYEIVGLPSGDQRHYRVVLQALDGTGRPEGMPLQRLATKDGVLLDGWGRRARRMAMEGIRD